MSPPGNTHQTAGLYDVDHKINVISSVLGVLQLTNDHGSRIQKGKTMPTGITGEEWEDFGPLLRTCIVHLEGMLYAYQMAEKSELHKHGKTQP